jgi:PAS domain-containing protein
MFIPPFAVFSLTFNTEIIWSNVVFFLEEMTVIIVIEAMYRHRSNYITIASLLNQINIAKQELQISATFETHEGMMITDANRVILRVNRAFTKITEYTAADVVGQTPRMLQSSRHDADFYHKRC